MTTVGRLTDVRKAEIRSEWGVLQRRMLELMHELGGTPLESGRMGSRDLSLAQTHLEDAGMRFTRHYYG